MSPRLAALVGLLAGILVAVVAVVLILADAPQISRMLFPSPSPAASAPAGPSGDGASGSPSPSASVSVPPVLSPGASVGSPSGGTASATASSGSSGAGPSVSPSASGPGGAGPSPAGTGFFIGQPPPKLVLPLVDGGTIDLAALHGHPVWVNWIDAKGIVRDGAPGGIGPDALAQALATILPGVKITP